MPIKMDRFCDLYPQYRLAESTMVFDGLVNGKIVQAHLDCCHVINYLNPKGEKKYYDLSGLVIETNGRSLDKNDKKAVRRYILRRLKREGFEHLDVEDWPSVKARA